MNRRWWFLALAVAFLGAHIEATEPPEEPPPTRDVSEPQAGASRIEWWRDAKFGLFVHWGPSSLTGKEISWARGGERPGLPDLPPGDVPKDEYDNLYRHFNPTEFDARTWVTVAKEAGMKYIVFTTKHHDGFCMFGSRLTPYNITQSPFRRDVVSELAAACHEADMGLGFYYSLPDWHHPSYRSDNHDLYVKYLHGQVRELCSNYGRVDVLWFDGKHQGTPETWDSPRLIDLIRELQPQVLINDRVHGETDFETPEQVIGRFEPTRPWEACITLGHQWSWKPNEELKPWQECVRLLALAAGGGGNLLLNVGPMPTGAIEPRQADTLRAIGAWLRRHGEAIYETRPGPFPPSFWGASTHRANTVYLLVFQGWEGKLTLPPIEHMVLSGQAIGNVEVKVVQEPNGIEIRVPPDGAHAPVTVIALTLDGPALDIAPKVPELSIPPDTIARAPNVRRNEANYAPVRAVDDDPLSRWATDDGITQTWLEIELPQPITFDVIVIDEAFGPRIRSFRLQAKDGDSWRTFFEGATIGRNWAAKLDPVTARVVRIEILEASDGPTIRDVRFRVVETQHRP